MDDILAAVKFIYSELIAWCTSEEVFRNGKKMRYLSGMDVELDSDDEELFVKPEDVQERRQKRDAILKRMIPPSNQYYKRLRIRF